MADLRLNGQQNNMIRFPVPLAGLTFESAGLVISTIADNEATPTYYTQAAGNIESISTLGTYAAPSTNKCRFKPVDTTYHPCVYEFQFSNARFAVTGAKSVLISVSGAGLPAEGSHYLVQLDAPVDVPDGIKKDVQYRYENSEAQYKDVTITDVP